MSLDTNKSSENYSKSSVITAYLFFGGPIGGGLIGLVVAIFIVLEAVSQRIIEPLALALLMVPICALFGLVLGLIPATLTGCLIAHLKLYRNDKGLSQSAIIGTIFTIIYALPFIIFADLAFSLAAYIFVIVIGSSSAYLTGLFTLPKA